MPVRYFPVFYALILSLGTVCCSTASRAQALAGANPTRKVPVLPTLYAGVKFGANFSYLSGDNWSNGVRSNLLGGVYAGIKGPGIGAQAEGLFEQSEYTTSSGFYRVHKDLYNSLADSLKAGTFKVNKLTLPVLVQFRVAHVIWIQAGVQFYGIISVRDFNGLLSDAKELFKSGNTAGVLGAAIHFKKADIGARTIFDFQNLNNLNTSDVWRQYMFQAYVGVKLF
ncbi:MAG: hypothetical protein JNL13_14370 [Chitinophagaceae bacterium]|nr:hypothetical protein [Chitinophagaceae bacterium]